MLDGFKCEVILRNTDLASVRIELHNGVPREATLTFAKVLPDGRHVSTSEMVILSFYSKDNKLAETVKECMLLEYQDALVRGDAITKYDSPLPSNEGVAEIFTMKGDLSDGRLVRAIVRLCRMPMGTPLNLQRPRPRAGARY